MSLDMILKLLNMGHSMMVHPDIADLLSDRDPRVCTWAESEDSGWVAAFIGYEPINRKAYARAEIVAYHFEMCGGQSQFTSKNWPRSITRTKLLERMSKEELTEVESGMEFLGLDS